MRRLRLIIKYDMRVLARTLQSVCMHAAWVAIVCSRTSRYAGYAAESHKCQTPVCAKRP